MNPSDPTQQNIQSPVQVSQDDAAVAQVVQNPASKAQIEIPVPVAIGNKEQAPVITREVSEYATDVEPSLPLEVEEAGVEAHHERARVPQDAAKMGLTPAKESVPVSANPRQATWPITAEKAQAVLSTPHLAIKNSVVWLATLVGKMVKKQKREEAYRKEIVDTE